jgi:hypothetical protein
VSEYPLDKKSDAIIAASAGATTTLPRDAAARTSNVLPKPQPPFDGKIGRTTEDSKPTGRTFLVFET